MVVSGCHVGDKSGLVTDTVSSTSPLCVDIAIRPMSERRLHCHASCKLKVA